MNIVLNTHQEVRSGTVLTTGSTLQQTFNNLKGCFYNASVMGFRNHRCCKHKKLILLDIYRQLANTKTNMSKRRDGMIFFVTIQTSIATTVWNTHLDTVHRVHEAMLHHTSSSTSTQMCGQLLCGQTLIVYLLHALLLLRAARLPCVGRERSRLCGNGFLRVKLDSILQCTAIQLRFC